MRENMGDHAGLAVPPYDTLQKRRLLQRGNVVLRGEPVRGGDFGHAREQAFFAAGPNQQLVTARNNERRAAAERPALFRRLARKALLSAAAAGSAARGERTRRTGRLPWGTDR